MAFDMKLTDVAPCQKELRVEIPREVVQQELEHVYQELKKVARVPGFRVGSAPRDLLEQHHGEKAREQALQRLIDRSLEEALASHKELDIVGRPQVTEVKFEPSQPLTYLARLEVAPEVPLGSYKGLRLTRPTIETSEEGVAQVLSHLQEQQAELTPVLESRAAAEGDYLLVDLTEKRQGKSPVKQRDLVIHLELKRDPDRFLKQLVGVTPPSQKEIQLKDGASVIVEVKGLKVKELPPLDDAFAKSVGPFNSLETLKQSVRGNLKREAESSQRRALEQLACDKLVEEWSFEVPPSLVASQARRILKERAMELMSQGVPSEQVQERAEFLADQAKLDALKQIKLFFILRRIAAAEGISAGEEEVNARIEALAGRMGATADQVHKDLEARDLLEELVWSVIRTKVFDLLLKEADVKDGGKG